MNIVSLLYYWLQIAASAFVTVFVGIVPFVRCLLSHSDKFYSIYFLALMIVGMALLRLSIKELRDAQKSDKV